MRFIYLKVLSLTFIVTLILLQYPSMIVLGAQVEGECTLAIATVSSSGEGVISSLTVIVKRPGSGLIFISVNPAVEVDVQGAARIAVLTASIVGDFNPLLYDYYFILNSPAIIVGGPSAGATMALAVLMAIKGLKCSKDYVVTGMINPDTTIGPVGGLKEKLEAIAASGAKTFVIPMGQSKYTYYERVVERKGPFTFIAMRPETIDLRDYGKRLGVTVIEVSSLANLYSLITGMEIAYVEGLLRDMDGLRRIAITIVEQVDSIVKVLEKHGVRGGLVEEVLRALRDARNELWSNESNYLALLRGIEAASLAQVALWSVEGFDVEVVYSNITEELERFNLAYEGLKDVDLGVVEVKGLALLHAWTSGMLLNKTYSGIKNKGFVTVDEALGMARALWEARVARLILEEAKPSGLAINIESLKVTSNYLVATARSTTAYSTQVFSETGIGSLPEEAILAVISASITKDPIASLYLASRSMSITTSAIHESFKTKTITFEEIARLALSLAIKSNSTLAQTLLRTALKLREYELLTEAMIISWATITLKNTETTHKRETPQPQLITAPIIKQGNETQYVRVQRVLQTILETSIWTLAVTTIILALITITTFIIYKRKVKQT